MDDKEQRAVQHQQGDVFLDDTDFKTKPNGQVFPLPVRLFELSLLFSFLLQIIVINMALMNFDRDSSFNDQVTFELFQAGEGDLSKIIPCSCIYAGSGGKTPDNLVQYSLIVAPGPFPSFDVEFQSSDFYSNCTLTGFGRPVADIIPHSGQGANCEKWVVNGPTTRFWALSTGFLLNSNVMYYQGMFVFFYGETTIFVTVLSPPNEGDCSAQYNHIFNRTEAYLRANVDMTSHCYTHGNASLEQAPNLVNSEVIAATIFLDVFSVLHIIAFVLVKTGVIKRKFTLPLYVWTGAIVLFVSLFSSFFVIQLIDSAQIPIYVQETVTWKYGQNVSDASPCSCAPMQLALSEPGPSISVYLEAVLYPGPPVELYKAPGEGVFPYAAMCSASTPNGVSPYGTIQPVYNTSTPSCFDFEVVLGGTTYSLILGPSLTSDPGYTTFKYYQGLTTMSLTAAGPCGGSLMQIVASFQATLDNLNLLGNCLHEVIGNSKYLESQSFKNNKLVSDVSYMLFPFAFIHLAALVARFLAPNNKFVGFLFEKSNVVVAISNVVILMLSVRTLNEDLSVTINSRLVAILPGDNATGIAPCSCRQSGTANSVYWIPIEYNYDIRYQVSPVSNFTFDYLDQLDDQWFNPYSCNVNVSMLPSSARNQITIQQQDDATSLTCYNYTSAQNIVSTAQGSTGYPIGDNLLLTGAGITVYDNYSFIEILADVGFFSNPNLTACKPVLQDAFNLLKNNLSVVIVPSICVQREPQTTGIISDLEQAHNNALYGLSIFDLTLVLVQTLIYYRVIKGLL